MTIDGHTVVRCDKALAGKGENVDGTWGADTGHTDNSYGTDKDDTDTGYGAVADSGGVRW